MRLMNVSPLWLVAAGVGFVALVLVFDLALAPATRALGEETTRPATQNEATNRDAARSRRARDAAEEQRADEESAPKPAAVSEPNASEGAPAAPAETAVASPSGDAASREGDNDAGAPASHLTIQIGAYRLQPQADEQADALRAAGFDARVIEERNGKRPWYCAQTGSFASRGEATQRLSELRAKGFTAQYTVRETN